MALAERDNCKDFIGIYYCGDWKLMQHIQVETSDLADLMWTKDDTAIVCWDSVLEPRILIYSATQGLIMKHEPYSDALGFRSILISPSGSLMVAGSCDSKVRMFNHISWK